MHQLSITKITKEMQKVFFFHASVNNHNLAVLERLPSWWEHCYSHPRRSRVDRPVPWRSLSSVVVSLKSFFWNDANAQNFFGPTLWTPDDHELWPPSIGLRLSSARKTQQVRVSEAFDMLHVLLILKHLNWNTRRHCCYSGISYFTCCTNCRRRNADARWVGAMGSFAGHTQFTPSRGQVKTVSVVFGRLHTSKPTACWRM